MLLLSYKYFVLIIRNIFQNRSVNVENIKKSYKSECIYELELKLKNVCKRD